MSEAPVEAVLDWRYELLSQAERRVFERLAVFSGAWTLEAAMTICAGDGVLSEEILDLLRRLARKSVVLARQQPDGEPRYRLSDTVHDYARQKLLSRGLSETTAVRARHADFFSTMARRICQVGTNTPAEALELLGDMRDSLRAALDWWLATARPLQDAPEGVGDARRVAVSGCPSGAQRMDSQQPTAP